MFNLIFSPPKRLLSSGVTEREKVGKIGRWVACKDDCILYDEYQRVEQEMAREG